MIDAGRSAWQDYWQTPPDARGGCLPASAAGLDMALARAWGDFAARLPRGARVLDLATGDGCVVKALLRVRRDLRVTGVDQAPALPSLACGAKLRGNVMLDALPYGRGSFAAATSQFGLEYAELDPAARELARVLVSGGKALLIVHRADSPIVAHNKTRGEAIDWAISQEDLPGQAKRYLQTRLLGAIPPPPGLLDAPDRGARLFGAGSAAWEIAEAIRRTLAGGAGEPAAITRAQIERICALATSERTRIITLQAAAARAGNGELVAVALERAGLVCVDQAPLDDGGGAGPVATRLVFRKP